MAHAIWKGSISLGLLNIPVTLRSATEEKSLSFSMLDERDFSPIKFKRINANTGKEVPYSKITKGFEFEPGEYVIVSNEDFKRANPKATQTLDIQDFVDLDEIDPMLFEKPYYLVPQKGGEKGYILLRDALKKTNRVAVATFVLRTKAHLVAIMAKENYLILEMMRFAHEVLEVKEADYLPKEIEKKVKYSDRELQMAEELVKGMTEKWKPGKYRDTYHEDLMKRIQQKIKAGEQHTIEEPEEIREPRATPVVDLLPLLQKSLEQKKKKAGRKAKGHGKAG